MLTFTTATNLMLSMTKVQSTDTANIALLQSLWNDSRRTVAGINGGKWPWLEIEESVVTVSGADYVTVPNKIRRVMAVRQQNGVDPTSVIYIPRMIFDAVAWDTILAAQLGSSNVPRFVYQRDNRLYIQPVMNESNDVVWIRGRIDLRDLSIADYSTGSIVSIANGATTVTGTGTSWTASMAGRYIRITESNTANNGDGYWYEVASVTSSTILELKAPYQGTTIAVGTAPYVLGQITYEPETYQMGPIYRAVALWLQVNDPLHPDRYNMYWRQYDGGQEAGLANLPGGLIGQMLEEANESMEGPYLSPLPRKGDIPDYPPYYYPWQLGTGM